MVMSTPYFPPLAALSPSPWALTMGLPWGR